MANLVDRLNTYHWLVRVNGKLSLGRISGQDIYKVLEGNMVERACTKKDKTKWKYFTESDSISVKGNFKLGDIVPLDDIDGNRVSFYVVDVGVKDLEGYTQYTVAR